MPPLYLNSQGATTWMMCLKTGVPHLLAGVPCGVPSIPTRVPTPKTHPIEPYLLVGHQTPNPKITNFEECGPWMNLNVERPDPSDRSNKHTKHRPNPVRPGWSCSRSSRSARISGSANWGRGSSSSCPASTGDRGFQEEFELVFQTYSLPEFMNFINFLGRPF